MDVLCFDDLDLFGADIDDPLAELEQDLYHRALETPGSNLDDPDRGLGMRDRMSGPDDPSLPAQVELEFRKDSRVDGVLVARTETSPGQHAIEATVQVNGQELGIDLDLAEMEGRIG